MGKPRARKPPKKPTQGAAVSNAPQTPKENSVNDVPETLNKQEPKKPMAPQKSQMKGKYVQILIMMAVGYLLGVNTLNFAWDINPVDATQKRSLAYLIDVIYNILTLSGTEKTLMYKIVLPTVLLAAMCMIGKRAKGSIDVCVIICLLIYLDGGLMSQLLSSPALLVHQILNVISCYLIFDVMKRSPSTRKWKVSGILCSVVAGLNTTLRLEGIIFQVALLMALFYGKNSDVQKSKVWGVVYFVTFSFVIVVMFSIFFRIPWIYIGRFQLYDYLDEMKLCQWSNAPIILEIVASFLWSTVKCGPLTKKFIFVLLGVCAGYVIVPFVSGDEPLCAKLVSIKIMLLTAMLVVMSKQKYPIFVYVVLLIIIPVTWVARYRFRPIEIDETDVFLL